jgi:hypothetical protein
VLELLNSFALWAGLSAAFSGWVVGYAHHVETRRHVPRIRHQPSALSAVSRLQ